jgi:hypothetical protein
MSNSRPLEVTAQLAQLNLQASPLAAMSWDVPAAVQLEEVTPAPLDESLIRRGLGFDDLIDAELEPSFVLRWQWPSRAQSPAKVSPKDGLLLRFANLAEAAPPAYLRFAKRWGPLRLCEHGLPGTHVPSDLEETLGDIPRCWMAGQLQFTEPIGLWRQYSRHAAAIIRITAQLKDGVPTPRDWWDPMRQLQHDEQVETDIEWAETYAPVDIPRKDLVASQEAGVERWINWWLRLAGIRPVLRWDEGLVLVGTGGLFGALAFQLANLVHADGHLAWCAVCGEFFTTERKRQAGRRTYCEKDDCRERGRRRLSARRNDA